MEDPHGRTDFERKSKIQISLSTNTYIKRPGNEEFSVNLTAEESVITQKRVQSNISSDYIDVLNKFIESNNKNVVQHLNAHQTNLPTSF